MKIIVDSREQTPFCFDGIETIKQKLDFADYACVLDDGHIVPIYFERKGISDLYSTLGLNYDRFKNEIIRCQEANSRMILIIEGTLTKVGKGIKHSKRPPEALLAQVMMLFVRYKIIPVFCKDANECSRYITLFYRAYEKNYLMNKNSNAV